jgi:hypothetical protein
MGSISVIVAALAIGNDVERKLGVKARFGGG